MYFICVSKYFNKQKEGLKVLLLLPGPMLGGAMHAGHMITAWDPSHTEPDDYALAAAAADAAAAATDDHDTGDHRPGDDVIGPSLAGAGEREIATPAVTAAQQPHSEMAAAQVGAGLPVVPSPAGVDASVDLPAEVEDMSHQAVLASLRESQGASKGAAMARALLRRLAAAALGEDIVATTSTR